MPRRAKRPVDTTSVEAAFKRLAGGHKRVVPLPPKIPDPIEVRRVARLDALIRQDGRCRYCRDLMKPGEVTAEHKKPRCRGGADAPENIAASCGPCNWTKGASTDGEFMRDVKRPPPGAPIGVLLAHIRRRLNLATERACKSIKRAAGI